MMSQSFTEIPTILVVDDNPMNLSLLFDALEQAGMQVRVAENGESALASIAQSQPDLVLLDVMMPGMNGFDVCTRLKANEATRDIPVIFMTALDSPGDEVRGFTVGAVDYVIKPIQVETTLARITTHLQLQSARRELQLRNAELNAYARMVAHDLKNPISAIITTAMYMSLSFDKIDPVDARDYLEVLLQSGQRAARTIDETLLLASLRRDQINIQPLDMTRIVTDATAQLSLPITQSGATIVTPDHWPVALGYAPWVSAVWVNYLSNGLKYGGTPPRLELGATPQPNGFIRFWVQDNGVGLSAEAQAQLFTEFTRLHEEKLDGHGLGLSIVRRTIEKLGGTVGLESQVGQGSRFFFSLLAADPAAPADVATESHAPA